MRIGTAFFGNVQQVNGQGISTQFFMLGIPLIPIKSMFVVEDRGTEKRGFEIDLHNESVSMGYARVICFVAGFTMLLLGILLRRELGGMIVPGVLFSLAWIYFQFFTGKPKKGDYARRLFLGQALGVNAFPQWLPGDVARNFYNVLEQRYEQVRAQYDGLPWQQCVQQQRKAQPGQFAMFYALCTYHQYFHPSAESDKMMTQVWMMAMG